MEAAIELAEAGALEEAATRFSALVADEPGNAEAWEMLAQVQMEQGHWSHAVHAATQASGLKPEWAEAHLTLARAHRNNGQLAEALAAYTKAQAAGANVPDEAQETEELYMREVALQVGLPTRIKTAPGAGLGPGGQLWDAGLLLAHVLVNQVDKGVLAGRIVLELGSGTGLVGITAAALGAQVVLTDVPEVMPLLEGNISMNQQLIAAGGGSATCLSFKWGAPQPSCSNVPDQEPSLPDKIQELIAQEPLGWLLGSDLVYSMQQVEQLEQALCALIAQLRWLARKQRQAGESTVSSPDNTSQDTAPAAVPPVQAWVMQTSCHNLRLLLAHKRRSIQVDLELFRMLHRVGFRLASPHEGLPPEQWVAQNVELATLKSVCCLYGLVCDL